jgi:hypothetical protein
MQTNAVNSNQSCTSGKYVSGFDTTGKIQCTTLPASTTTTVTT